MLSSFLICILNTFFLPPIHADKRRYFVHPVSTECLHKSTTPKPVLAKDDIDFIGVHRRLSAV
jgi:hypothetical protein